MPSVSFQIGLAAPDETQAISEVLQEAARWITTWRAQLWDPGLLGELLDGLRRVELRLGRKHAGCGVGVIVGHCCSHGQWAFGRNSRRTGRHSLFTVNRRS